MIGISVAMESEAAPFIEKSRKTESFFGKNFYFLDIEGEEAVLVICGIGKVNAAFGTALLIEKYRPEIIINFGVAGALCDGLKHLDLVAVSKAVQHDADTTAFGDPKGLVCTVNKIFFETDEESLELLKAQSGMKVGISACGDQFVALKEKKDEIRRIFNASVCDMESGAISHCAYMAGIKFVSIKCISDVGNDSAVGEYRHFLPKAANKLCDAVREFIRERRK